ncbi:hypothetical protein BU15DRAFT_61998 [Melanogaster broomeanus]|nr:hypothetical protein BU15DRAFT_61998 [Melanogaster broomeanus]
MGIFDTLRRRRDEGIQSTASDSGRSSDMHPEGKPDIMVTEKGLRRPESASTDITEGDTEDVNDRIINTDDPFPEVPGTPVEEQQLTVRAVLVGCALGGIIAASNIYLGLKTGWTFGASLFGSILGFAILKPLSRAAPSYLGGGYFGPKENNVCQSAATSAGSLGLLFTSGFPAAYQLGLLSTHPKDDLGRLITFTICCAFFGLSFTQPLRKFYILKLKLVFPAGVAAAYTIQSLHVGKNAEGAIILRVVSEYAPGILWDWHIFYTLNRIGWSSSIGAESWELYLRAGYGKWTPAFIGVVSLVAYSFLAWAIIGPIIVAKGMAFGSEANASIPGYMNYMDMTLTDPIHHPSPRYWLLWPGTLMLLCASFAEVACNWRSLYFRDALRMWDASPALPKCLKWVIGRGRRVRPRSGKRASSVLGLGLRLRGNASQLIFGGLGKGQNYAVKRGELLNLLSGMLTLGAAEQAGDMIGDLKTTHLLRASPRAVFVAQLFGAIVSIFMAAGLYVVFSTAYPCINDLSYATCPFPTPDVQSWRAVAVAVSSSALPIPPSSGYTAIALGLVAVFSVVAKYTVVPPKYHDFIPNFNAIGIGFIMNVCTYPLAMFFGSTIAFFWRKMFFNNYQMYCFAIAAGFIAGEGLGGIVNAIFTIAGISGAMDLYGPGVWRIQLQLERQYCSQRYMFARLNQVRTALFSLATQGFSNKGVDPAQFRSAMTSASQKPEIATFAAGCFWGVEHIFLKHYPPAQNKGILKTAVGYTGGKDASVNPSYREVCSGTTNHAEALRIEFDPSVVSYNELGADTGTQYRSAIFTHSPEQATIAKRVTEEVQAKHFTPKGQKIVTDILDAGEWYDAEGYHQLYLFNNPQGYQCPTHRLHW